MKKDKRFSLRLRTYYLLIIAIVVIISFGAVVGALTALQQLGVIGHINVSTLVGNILMLSKLENQSLSDQRSTFRLDEQLRQAVVMLEPQWEEKSLSFRAELDAVSVTACEPLLLQVWTNLIGNAIKFSEPGQELSLRLLDQTECAVVSVMDHGCGMTPEVQARIFEKFYQGDSSRKAMGNGLGLPLVKRIVELSDGVIEVDSAPGQGSTFRVILPKK